MPPIEIPQGWTAPIYTVEGTPHIFIRWNDRDVPVLTGIPAAWHEDRHKAGEETWALMNAIVACTNAAPDMAARIVELEAALRPFAECATEGNEDFPDKAPASLTLGRSKFYALTLGDFRRARTALGEGS